jgi:hypothetical protein
MCIAFYRLPLQYQRTVLALIDLRIQRFRRCTFATPA